MLDSVFYFSQKFQVFGDVFMNGGPTTQDRGALRPARRANYGTRRKRAASASRRATRSSTSSTTTTCPASSTTANPDVRALRASLAYLLTEDGIPCIYYGTEQDFAAATTPRTASRSGRPGCHRRRDLPVDRAPHPHPPQLHRALRRGDESFTLRWVTDRTGDGTPRRRHRRLRAQNRARGRLRPRRHQLSIAR
jgi:alpha-amylase